MNNGVQSGAAHHSQGFENLANDEPPRSVWSMNGIVGAGKARVKV